MVYKTSKTRSQIHIIPRVRIGYSIEHSRVYHLVNWIRNLSHKGKLFSVESLSQEAYQYIKAGQRVFFSFITTFLFKMPSLWILVLVVVCLLKAGIIPTMTLYLLSTAGDRISTPDFKPWHLVVCGATLGLSTVMEVVVDSQSALDGGIMNISRSFVSIMSTIFAIYMAACRCKEQRAFNVPYLVSIGSILGVFIATRITGKTIISDWK